MCRGTNVQYAKQDVLFREDLICNDSHSFTEEIIRRARATLAKWHTEKINDYYILLAHPDVVYELKNKLKICNVTGITDSKKITAQIVGEIHDVLIVETNKLPTYKNTNGSTVYSSVLFGDYAFGLKVDEENGTFSIARINEMHLVRIETVA